MSTAQPFPPIPKAEKQTGVTITVRELAVAIGIDVSEDEGLAVATRLRAVCGLYAERYAPQAPSALLNESVLRFAAYLLATQDLLGFREIGRGIDVTPMHLHGPAWRNCGAAMLLAPWKIRRAGAI